ncbi:pentapeptide repeat-containing protein [Candidatus Williamhamiltonella defendens]|uniref:pentapeptide repeat-containing protein n=1 Tax=Candidatus Williamhamiltonella defendens TaxID=138072 RepID=UPI0007400531|nr:pentapeptide repeat-containing protein [Candidatus Hamiltonella defensa]
MPGPVHHKNTPPIHHHTPTSQPNKLSRFLKALRRVSNDICTRFVDLFCGCFSKPKPGKENITSKTPQGDSQPLNNQGNFNDNRERIGPTENGLSASSAKSIEEIMELVENHTDEHPANLQKYHGASIEYKQVFTQLREKRKTVLDGLRLPEKANLTNANLDGFKLICLNAHGADFRGSTLQNTHMQGADMHRTNLNDLDLRTTILLGAYLDGASLQNVNFSGNQLLESAYFLKAKLQKANFNETELVGVHFIEANLEGATFNNAIFGYRTQLPRAILDQAELKNATCIGTIFYKASLLGAHLEGANCNSASFNAKLKGAHLKGTDFTNADLRNVDMTEDELRASGAILNGAKVGNASTWKKL